MEDTPWFLMQEQTSFDRNTYSKQYGRGLSWFQPHVVLSFRYFKVDRLSSFCVLSLVISDN